MFLVIHALKQMSQGWYCHANRPDNQSLIPRTHMWGKEPTPLSCLLTSTDALGHVRMYTQ